MLNSTLTLQSLHLPYGGKSQLLKLQKNPKPKKSQNWILKSISHLKTNNQICNLVDSSTPSPMDEPGTDPDPGSYPIPPASVHLSPFFSYLVPPLSTHFTRRCQPLQSSRRLAYISLQGLLVNSDEASSARSIGGGLSREETLAWELFTPYQRFLIVAVIGVAAAESKKNRVIRQLQKSVDLRVRIDSLTCITARNLINFVTLTILSWEISVFLGLFYESTLL